MYVISKDFTWSASHVLNGLPEGHQCGRLHGHNYTARVILEADTLDGNGFVIDYGLLAPFGAWIDATFDHRHLNDAACLHGVNPTAENLSMVLGRQVPELVNLRPGVRVRVAVSETAKTWAEYRP